MPSDDKIITPTLSSVSGGNHPFAELCGKWTGSQVLSQEICIQVLALLKSGHGTLEIYSGFSCTKRSKWALHLYNPSFHFSVFLPAPSWLMWIGIYPRTTHDYFTKYNKIVVQLFSHVQLFANPWTTVCQASLSFTSSLSLLKLISIYLVGDVLHPPRWFHTFTAKISNWKSQSNKYRVAD